MEGDSPNCDVLLPCHTQDPWCGSKVLHLDVLLNQRLGGGGGGGFKQCKSCQYGRLVRGAELGRHDRAQGPIGQLAASGSEMIPHGNEAI